MWKYYFLTKSSSWVNFVTNQTNSHTVGRIVSYNHECFKVDNHVTNRLLFPYQCKNENIKCLPVYIHDRCISENTSTFLIYFHLLCPYYYSIFIVYSGH